MLQLASTTLLKVPAAWLNALEDRRINLSRNGLVIAATDSFAAGLHPLSHERTAHKDGLAPTSGQATAIVAEVQNIQSVSPGFLSGFRRFK
tara:strand:- start:264 stop:536 length:273 start_codon:yes stop_codon:yes gene_type:complete